jgi:hypothetical protein
LLTSGLKVRNALVEPTLTAVFPTQPLEDTPFAASSLGCAHHCKFTRPYPNFLFLEPEGTPSFPPVLFAEASHHPSCRPGSPIRSGKKASSFCQAASDARNRFQSRRVPQPPQNSPLPGSAAPQLVQKGFGDEIVPLGTPAVLDLFAPNLRTILRIRMEAIASRISPRKLSVGIINSPGVRATVPSAKAVEQNRRVKGGRRRGLRGCSATVASLRVHSARRAA